MFDIKAAREAGYSDEEIADYLAQKSSFDIGAAREAGYSPGEIIAHLSKPKGLVDRAAEAVKPKAAPENETAPAARSAASPPEIDDAQEAASAGADYWTGGVKQEKPGVVKSFERGVKQLSQGASATALSANQRYLDIINRIDAGEKVREADDPMGYQQMSPEQRKAARAQVESSFAGSVSSVAKKAEELKAMPQNEKVEAMTKAKTFGAVWDAFKQAPVEIVYNLFAESLPQMAPGLAGAVVAGPAGGAPLAAAAMGAGSYATEYASGIVEALTESGIDVSNPEALRAAVADGKLMQAIRARAATKAGVVASLDAASGGVAGKVIAPAKMAARPIAREATNIAAQAPIQAGLGAGGEALGAVAAGKDVEPGAVAAEGIAEFATTPADILALALTRGKARVRPGAKQTPEKSPDQVASGLIDQAVAGATINPQAVEGAAVEAMRDPSRAPVVDAGPASARPSAYRETSGAEVFGEAVSALSAASSVDEAIAAATSAVGAVLDQPSASQPQSPFGVPPEQPQVSLARGGFTGERGQPRQELPAPQPPGEGQPTGIIDSVQPAAPTQAGGVVSGVSQDQLRADAAAKRGTGELMSASEMELARQFDAKPAPTIASPNDPNGPTDPPAPPPNAPAAPARPGIVDARGEVISVGGRETKVADMSDGELAHAGNLTRSPATKQIIVAEQMRRREPQPAQQPPAGLLSYTPGPSGETIVASPTGAAQPATQARETQLARTDTQEGSKRLRVPAAVAGFGRQEPLASARPSSAEPEWDDIDPDTLSEPKVTGTGKVVGAPSGMSSEGARTALVRKVVSEVSKPMAVSEKSKDWYEDSGREIARLARGDRALIERTTRLMALYSQGNSAEGNTTATIKSLVQLARGQTPEAGRYPNMTKPVADAVLAAEKMSVKIPGVNHKVLSFYRNLIDPALGENNYPDAVTIDRWMMRKLGYKFAESGETGGASNLSASQYAYARDVMLRATKAYNQKHGTNLHPRQLQSMLWTLAKSEGKKAGLDNTRSALKQEIATYKEMKAKGNQLAGEEARRAQEKLDELPKTIQPKSENFAHHFRRMTALLTWETVPSTRSGLLPGISRATPEQLVEFTKAAHAVLLDEQGNNALFEKVSLVPLYSESYSKGTFEKAINPNILSGLVLEGGMGRPDAKTANLVADLLGYIYSQDAVPWHMPDPGVSKKDGRTLGIEVKWSGEIDDAGFYAHVGAKIPGAEYTKMADGSYRFLNFTGLQDSEFQSNLMGALVSFETKANGEAQVFFARTAYREGGENGKDYLQRIREAGRSDLLRWARGRREALSAVYEDFGTRYGWSEREGQAGDGVAAGEAEGLTPRASSKKTPPSGGVSVSEPVASTADRPVSPAKHIEIKAAITRAVEAVGGTGTTWPDGTRMRVVSHPDEIKDSYLRSWVSKNGDDMIEGFYDPESKEIYIISSNLDSVDRALFVATAHEVFHAGLRKTIGAEAVDPVMRAIYARNKRVRDAAARLVAQGLSIPVATEEVLADMPDRGDLKGWDKLLALIKNFLAKLGVVKWTDEQVEMLVSASRASVRAPDGPVSVTVERQTETPAFRKWFGDSKAVGEDGRPIAFYHSTTGDFNSFSEWGTLGNHFGTLQAAHERSVDYGKRMRAFGIPNSEDDPLFVADENGIAPAGANTMPVYLSVQKPLAVVDVGNWMDSTAVLDGILVRRLPRDLRNTLQELRDEIGQEREDGLYDNMQDFDWDSDDGRPAPDWASAWTLSPENERGLADIRSALEMAGYDSISYENSVEDRGSTSYLVFRSNQIKSAIGNNGNFDPSEDDITKSEKAPVFYSELARQIAATKNEVMPAQQWKAYIANLTAKGVKKDEIEWSGVKEFLDLQNGKITRQQILDYLSQNGVKVEEKVLGHEGLVTFAPIAGEDGPEMILVDGEVRGTIVPTLKGFEKRGNDKPIYQIKSMVDASILYETGVKFLARRKAKELFSGEGGSTKFQSYTIPGGTNYREVLLTLPERDTITETRVDAPRGWGDTDGGNVGVEWGGDTGADFRSSHFDVPNIIAHVRVNDREDAEGRKILFIEEIQSDWAQKGKRVGFSGRGEPGSRAERDALLREANSGPLVSQERMAQIQSRLREIADGERVAGRNPAAVGVPLAPFVTKTEAWVSLAVKRAIRMAVDGGYDGIAWTTGEQQSSRYDLSKQVDQVSVGKVPDEPGKWQVVARRGGDVVIDTIADSDSKLSETIGKDLADKAVAKGGGTFEGLDLKVGGEGMKAFYDSIVPNVVKDVLKKVGGGQVGDVRFSPERSFVVVDALGRDAPDRWRVDEVYADGARVAYAAAPTKARAQSVAERENAKLQGKTLRAQPGFYLTPDMKAKAQQGLPMFSQRPGLAGIAGQMQQAAGAMKKAKPDEYKESRHWGRALQIMEALAQDEWSFKYGKSDSRDWNEIVRDMRLDDVIERVEPVLYGGKKTTGIFLKRKRTQMPIVDYSTESAATEALKENVAAFVSFGKEKLRAWQGDDAYTDVVWVDSSALQKGEGGKAIYQLVYTWAANNGFVFIPDPASVSPAAVEARVANAISASLRLGTTKFMDPFTYPGDKDNEFEGSGVNPHYQWRIPRWLIEGYDQWKPVETPGDEADRHNMRVLLGAQLAMANQKLKDSARKSSTKIVDETVGVVDSLEGFRYNFDTDKIVYEDTDEPVAQATLDRVAETLVPPGVEIPRLRGEGKDAGEGVSDGSGSAPADAAQAGTPSRRGARAAMVRALVVQSAVNLTGTDAATRANRLRDNAGSALGTARAELLASRRPDWIESGSADLKSAASKIDTFAPQKTFADKVKALKPVWKQWAVQKIFDAYAPLQKLGHREYVLARMARSGGSSLEAMLLYGKPRLGADGAIHGDLDGKGFLGHMADLKGEHDRFFMWVAGRRAQRLAGEGRENLFAPGEIADMAKLDGGQMKDGSSRKQAYANALLALSAYNKSVLDIAEATGLIDGEARSNWEHEFYVPFFRVDEDMKLEGPSKVKGLVRQKAFEKLKGGTENLGDLLDNTMRNWSHLIDASLANQAAVASMKKAEQLGIATRTAAGEKGATYVMQGGKQIWYEVSDPFVLDAVSALESASFNHPLMKVMGKFKHYLTLGVTVSPTFRVRNLIRDSISAIGQNDLSYNAANNVWQGFAAMDRSKKEYQEALFNGAVIRFGQLTDGKHAEHAKRLILDGVDDASILDTPAKVRAALGKAWDFWQETGDKAENVNRMSRYQQGLARGESALEAAFASRDMMDFSLQGSSQAVRFLSQLVPFMNARLQGMYKLGRSAKQDPARFATVAGAVALLSVGLLFAYKDDEEWKKREDWDRDNFWWIKLGDTAVRIPKPFELGSIGTIAERSVEAMISDEMTGERFYERMKSLLGDTLALNPVPQLFKPAIDLYANKDSFSGRQIESRGMEKLSKPERYGPNTTLAAKTIGKAGNVTGLSPVQVDHLIRAYFGWLGSHIAMIPDLVAQPFDDKEKPARKVGDTFVVGDFVKDLPAGRSRYIEEFYKQAKAIDEVMGDIRRAREAGEAAKIEAILKSKGEEVALSRFYDAIDRKIGEVNRRARIIRESNFSAEVKRQRLDELDAVRNKLAEQAARAKAARRAATRGEALPQ